MRNGNIEQAFTAAVNGLVSELKQDRSILAAILCGSLAHDTVWEKSDVDLLLVTIDDRKIDRRSIALYADGVNIHTMLMSRTDFRRTVEGSIRNSFMHSLLAKGRLLYTHDPTIADLCATLTELGKRDMQLQLLQAGTCALPPLYKARKWFLTRGDLDYTALWILYAATPLAQVEVISAGRLTGREVIPQALELNPTFFTTIYSDLLNTRKTRKGVLAALEAAEGYIAARAESLFAPVIEYLRDEGETRSATEIETHFTRQMGVSEVVTACEYLADQHLVGKAAAPARLTKKSNVDVQELAFFYIDTGAHAR